MALTHNLIILILQFIKLCLPLFIAQCKKINGYQQKSQVNQDMCIMCSICEFPLLELLLKIFEES